MTLKAPIITLPRALAAALACLLLGLVIGGLLVRAELSKAGASGIGHPVSTASKDDLEKQKLVEEVRQLRSANDSHLPLWDWLAAIVPAVTAGAAFFGVLVTYWKTLDDREQERLQRNQEISQREEESKRWQAEQQAARRKDFDDRFSQILTNLSAKDDQGKAGGAVSLMTFLKPEYADFYEPIYLILHSTLKLIGTQQAQNAPHSSLNQIFVRAYERALPIAIAAPDFAIDADFARMYLRQVNLSKLNLNAGPADIGFCFMPEAKLEETQLFRARGMKINWVDARLSRAKLGEARLNGADCRGAEFCEALLVSATLKKADCRDAKFSGARLQSAHFEGAKLEGAQFAGADVNDAYFQDATFDGAAIKSMIKAKNWDKAHFSADVKAALDKAFADAEQKKQSRNG